MTRPVDIRPDHLETVQRILRENLPAGVKVWVFGSRANWTTKDSSDLDLALEGDGSLGHKLLGALKDAFDDSALPYTVDVVDVNRIGGSFRLIVESQKTRLPLDGHWTSQRVGLGSSVAGGATSGDVKLGDVATIVMGQSPPGSTVSDDPGIALLNGPTEFGPHHPTPVQFTTDPRKLAQPGDVLFCVRGSTTGRMNWADKAYAIGRGVAAIRHAEDPTLQPLLRGAIEVALPELLIAATGSTFPNVSANQIVDIPYPDLSVEAQRAIAHVLGTLDDKIELNRRMNETLEEMARALFKSWFVNFDPVRAKIEGRWRPGESLPGLPADLYDLFPDRLVLSELGEIPEGWEVKTLGSYLETLETGYRPPGGVSGIVAGIPSMGAESVERVGVFDFSKTKYVPLEFYNGMNRGIVEDGDVLIYKDGGRPGELKPAVTYISHGFPFNVFCINEHVYRVRTKRFSQQLLYCYLTTSTAFWQMRELATGVAQPGLNRRSVESIAIAVPADNRVLSTCQERIGPLLDECNINSLESWGLSQIRDTLLPKLVSGEVVVSPPTSHTNGGGSD